MSYIADAIKNGNLPTEVVLGHHGQYGDLFINLGAIQYASYVAGYRVTMPINKKYADAAPLFLNQKSIRSIIITEGYEQNDFTDKDLETFRRYGKSAVFNPMNRHQDDWWKTLHQVEMVARDFFTQDWKSEFRFPNEGHKKLELRRWFDLDPEYGSHRGKGKYIAFAPFAGFYNKQNDKALTVDRATRIAEILTGLGYMVIHIGGKDEPKIPFTYRPNTNYFEAVRIILSCDLLLHTDTGLGWAASCYDHPAVGLYSNAYYGKEFIKNIQPINPNAVYLDEVNVNDIPIEKIVEAVRKQLKIY